MKKFIFRKIFLFLFLILNVSGQLKKTEIIQLAETKTFLLNRFFKSEFIFTGQICRGGEKFGCPVEVYTSHGNKKFFKLAYISNEDKLSEEFYNNFIRECFILREFDHFNIVKLYAAFRDKLVMYQELASGDLLQYIPRIKGIKNEIRRKKRIFNIINQITEGLNYLHENRYIHGDLKPSNVIVFLKNKSTRKKKPFRVALIDFSRTIQISENQTFIELNKIFTTPLFASNSMVKEFYGNEKCIYDFKDDIYSLGMIIYELVYHNEISILDQADKFLLNLDEKFKDLKYMKTSKDKPKKQKILLDKNWKPEIEKLKNPYYKFFNNLIMRCLDIERKKRPSSKEILKELEIFKNEYFEMDDFKDINTYLGYDSLLSLRFNTKKGIEFDPFKK